MPELPEVEMARRYVQRNILHAKVARLEVLDPRMWQERTPNELQLELEGNEVVGTGRHGKNLFICFEDGLLHIHLGMSGALYFYQGLEHHSSHERLRLITDRGVMILDDPRRFGRFGWTSSMDDLVASKGLGPDALSVPKEEFLRRLEGRKGSLKSTLLNQRVIAGLGNLYVDEVLFQESLHPRTPLPDVSPANRCGLWRSIRSVLEASIEVGTNFERLPRGYLLRQRERGSPCPRCDSRLQAAMVGGRTSVFCPECQKVDVER